MNGVDAFDTGGNQVGYVRVYINFSYLNKSFMFHVSEDGTGSWLAADAATK